MFCSAVLAPCLLALALVESDVEDDEEQIDDKGDENKVRENSRGSICGCILGLTMSRCSAAVQVRVERMRHYITFNVTL